MSALQLDPLAPVFAPLTSLRGIGPSLAALIGRAAGGQRVIDLLFHLPESYLDRRDRPTIARAVPGRIATLEVEVIRHDAPANARQPWKILVRDPTGFAELVFFRFNRQAQMPPGARLLVSGKLEKFGDRLTMPHPDHVVPADRPERLPGLEPVWPLTAGLWPRQVAAAIAQALERVPELPEWHDPALLRRERWPGFRAALRRCRPRRAAGDAARRRLAYDELLADQIALALVRGRVRARPGRALIRVPGPGVLPGTGPPTPPLLPATGLATPSPTPRSGPSPRSRPTSPPPAECSGCCKATWARARPWSPLLAMLRAAEAGAQAALMAPTEVLAKQHHRTLSRLCPVPVALLTGSVKGTARAHTLRGLADGSIPLVVGTHALFQEAVSYHDLALAVIDEQHRFGVHQRVMLGDKGERTDVLVMTATPIPRTLLLTQWGEMDVSRLDEKPPGRQPIRTTLHSLATLPDVLDALARKLEEGGQIYWVCPMVAESELLDVAAAEARFADLRARFGATVGLAHGRQDADVARRRARRFRRRPHPPAGRDHGDRGRRRRAASERHGDRARRTLRPRATAPVARPCRPRHGGEFLPVAAR